MTPFSRNRTIKNSYSSIRSTDELKQFQPNTQTNENQSWNRSFGYLKSIHKFVSTCSRAKFLTGNWLDSARSETAVNRSSVIENFAKLIGTPQLPNTTNTPNPSPNPAQHTIDRAKRIHIPCQDAPASLTNRPSYSAWRGTIQQSPFSLEPG